ncbi:hypothetical protein [Verminephrobacter aporrectodeae]|nr:hypothetical protein [Verminephrobacter aporrectodeae]
MSFALGGVSRACFISELRDLKIEKEALLFFKYLGMPDRFYELRNKSRNEQARHAIFESITTDYGSVRYYLLAESRVYKKFIHPVYRTTELRKYKDYTSDGWDSVNDDPDVFKEDSRLSIFKHNRELITSVRAGNPDFVEAVDYRWDEMQNMFVMGMHAYYDPKTKSTNFLEKSWATDCNLSNWGIQER